MSKAFKNKGDILALMGMIIIGVLQVLCIIAIVSWFIPKCTQFVESNKPDLRIRQYELDGVVVQRQSDMNATRLFYIQDGQIVDEVHIGYKDLSNWLLIDMFFEEDGTILLRGERISRPLRWRLKSNPRFILVKREIDKRIDQDSLWRMWNHLDRLRDQGRRYCLENVSAECEDTLYNRDSHNHKVLTTRVKMSLLDDNGNVVYTNQE